MCTTDWQEVRGCGGGAEGLLRAVPRRVARARPGPAGHPVGMPGRAGRGGRRAGVGQAGRQGRDDPGQAQPGHGQDADAAGQRRRPATSPAARPARDAPRGPHCAPSRARTVCRPVARIVPRPVARAGPAPGRTGGRERHPGSPPPGTAAPSRAAGARARGRPQGGPPAAQGAVADRLLDEVPGQGGDRDRRGTWRAARLAGSRPPAGVVSAMIGKCHR